MSKNKHRANKSKRRYKRRSNKSKRTYKNKRSFKERQESKSLANEIMMKLKTGQISSQ